ncbi:RIP metalloprotease [Cellulomonas sp. URHE0023]|uniref:M50 family metallopeptidase n=1 Tax=Cellulomonas sp. URHE0023 TaxID=1380354 RepID=UPI0004831F07|nr:site-2 protease family protein [Cellulomonas sp. URHE0023]
MEYLVGLVIFVVVLLGSIALHEVGHMVPAKRFGVRVSHYMVGFGPTLWSRTKGETEYGFKAIPAGGYVRLVGMYPPAEAVGNPPARTWLGRLASDARQASAEEIHPGEDGRAFYRLSTPKKLVVMLGGPVMNLLIAFALLAIVFVGIGVPGPTTTVDTVSACVIPTDAPADRTCTSSDPAAPGAAAGLLPGDTVVSYDGTSVESWDQLTGLIRSTGDEAVPITVERDGTTVDLSVTPVVADRPVYDEYDNPVMNPDGTPKTTPAGYIGIGPQEEPQRETIWAIPGKVASMTGETASVVVRLPSKIGELWSSTVHDTPRDTSSVVGVVGIGRFAGEIASEDNIDWGLKLAGLLSILASLNIALFVFNLIPLPPLDGGHVAAALWEGGRRQVARLRGAARPGPFDSAKLVPVAYSVFILLGGVGLLLVYADLVNPVQI